MAVGLYLLFRNDLFLDDIFQNIKDYKLALLLFSTIGVLIVKGAE